MQDQFGRKIEYLRISLTDRCNLRCVYCMPTHGIRRLPRETMLTFEELLRLVRIFAALGIRRIRLTGGEPLLRPKLPELIAQLCAVDGIEHVALTTNGTLFSPMAEALKSAGLHAVTFSLDTLRADRFQHITRSDSFGAVLDGLERAYSLGFSPIKINCVPLLGINDEDWISIASLAKHAPLDVRFIELMPIGCAKAYLSVPTAQVYQCLSAHYGSGKALPHLTGTGPAEYVSFPGFQGRIGFISPMTHSFCTQCNRVRLTAQGYLRLCLQKDAGCDLRTLLRSGSDDSTLAGAIQGTILKKPACHSFSQAAAFSCEESYMHTIGG